MPISIVILNDIFRLFLRGDLWARWTVSFDSRGMGRSESIPPLSQKSPLKSKGRVTERVSQEQKQELGCNFENLFFYINLTDSDKSFLTNVN